MKRYFVDPVQKQVVMIEFRYYSILSVQTIPELFGDNTEVVEVNKAEYLRVKSKYEAENETNMSMTITR